MLATAYPLLERLHPDGARELARTDAAAWESADPAPLPLCSLAVAQLLKTNRHATRCPAR